MSRSRYDVDAKIATDYYRRKCREGPAIIPQNRGVGQGKKDIRNKPQIVRCPTCDSATHARTKVDITWFMCHRCGYGRVKRVK